METELLNYFVRGDPQPQPRPRARIIFVQGKPTVTIYDQLRAYEPNTKPRVRKAWDAERWRDRIIERTRAAAGGVGGLPIEGPVRMDLDFYFPRPGYMLSAKHSSRAILHCGRPDVDNLFKLVADAITQAGWREIDGDTIKTSLVWGDDGQVCDCQVKKFYVARGDAPGVMIKISRLSDPAPTLPGLAEPAMADGGGW